MTTTTSRVEHGTGTEDSVLDVPFADCWITEQAQAAAQRVLASGWVTTGTESQAFEAELASYVGASHAVSASSCTAAIELSLRSLRLAQGTAVLTSTMTFCGAVHAIEHAGLRPVLVDVDPDTGMPTPATVARAAEGTRRAGQPAGAIVLVHWAGDPFDRASLAEAAGLPESRVVEDAAHGLGSQWHGVDVGQGAAVCFSFYATKNLPIGEGGMVTTDDPDRADWIRRARLHGMSQDAWRRYLPGGSWRYDVAEAGLKANMSDLQAAIGRAQLSALPGWQARREGIAERYDALLADADGVSLPHRPRPGEGRHAWHLYAIQLTGRLSRDEAAAALARRGVSTSVHFIPVHRLGHFAPLAPTGGLPGADLMFERLLSLPLYPRLSSEQVDHVATALTEALEGDPR
jgi:dTDP-4-amino-4,6-dideoxygalactose transaminase